MGKNQISSHSRRTLEAGYPVGTMDYLSHFDRRCWSDFRPHSRSDLTEEELVCLDVINQFRYLSETGLGRRRYVYVRCP